MQTKTNNQVYAGFFVRLAAYLIDLLVMGIALLAVKVPLWISSIANPNNLLVRDFIYKYSIADIVIYVLLVTYFILPTYYAGRTLGKRLLQLKVISVEDRSMTFFEVVYRETVGRFLSGILLGVGYLMIVIDKEKRGIHDLLADTKVIYYHEKKEPVPTPIVYQPTQRPIIYPENQKSYYRNVDMNPQNMQSPSGNPMANSQNMQSPSGNSMTNRMKTNTGKRNQWGFRVEWAGGGGK
ncbi:MAG: RDD family protein, partial [Lachnospiraceae bacterium]|nr:RDD family protein [Lachnospiraceae bacterium]